jgi:hypothetical protein
VAFIDIGCLSPHCRFGIGAPGSAPSAAAG